MSGNLHLWNNYGVTGPKLPADPYAPTIFVPVNQHQPTTSSPDQQAAHVAARAWEGDRRG